MRGWSRMKQCRWCASRLRLKSLKTKCACRTSVTSTFFHGSRCTDKSGTVYRDDAMPFFPFIFMNIQHKEHKQNHNCTGVSIAHCKHTRKSLLWVDDASRSLGHLSYHDWCDCSTRWPRIGQVCEISYLFGIGSDPGRWKAITDSTNCCLCGRRGEAVWHSWRRRSQFPAVAHVILECSKPVKTSNCRWSCFGCQLLARILWPNRHFHCSLRTLQWLSWHIPMIKVHGCLRGEPLGALKDLARLPCTTWMSTHRFWEWLRYRSSSHWRQGWTNWPLLPSLWQTNCQKVGIHYHRCWTPLMVSSSHLLDLRCIHK